MIVADTNIWAHWFNALTTPAIRRLDAALARGEIGVPPLILAEVLQGFRTDEDFRSIARHSTLQLCRT